MFAKYGKKTVLGVIHLIFVLLLQDILSPFDLYLPLYVFGAGLGMHNFEDARKSISPVSNLVEVWITQLVVPNVFTIPLIVLVAMFVKTESVDVPDP